MISAYTAGLLAEVGIAVIGALSVYVILATGQLSLGNAAFMAIGAYVSSVLTVRYGLSLTPAILIAAAVSALIGGAVGFPALRLEGIYLAVATLGFGEMTRSFFLYFEPTGGAAGFSGMAHVSLATIWIWVAVILAGVLAVERSRLWLEFRAVHDDETAAGLVGLNTTALKVGAFVAGAAIAGVAGALFAHQHVYIEPGNFGFERSVEMVLSVILGGSTLAVGAVLGAGLLVLLPEFLRFVADWRLAAFGGLLIAILLVRPQGILDRRLLRLLVLRPRASTREEASRAAP